MKQQETMTSDELQLRQRFPNANPFIVPDGYFDQLTAKVMERLPQENQQAQELPLANRPHRWRYAAILAVLCVLTATLFLGRDNQSGSLLQDENASVAYSYFDEVADYVMLDNSEIYACLSSE